MVYVIYLQVKYVAISTPYQQALIDLKRNFLYN